MASVAEIVRHKVLRGKDEYLRGYVQYMSFDLPLLWHLLTEKAPDVFVCEPPPTTGAVVRVVSAIKRRPYVYYAADIWSDAAEGAGVNGMVVSALRILESWVLRGAAGVLAVSDPVGERVGRLGARNVHVVRNGVDTDVFTPDGPASPLDGMPYFLYAGTMSEWQGADIFVEAFASFASTDTDTQLVFVGQGSALEDLRRTANDLGIADRVHFLPPVDQEEAAAYQRGALAALVSIKPGIGYDLAFPTKAMAAWASGVPVVYAGPGVAVPLIADHDLGWACGFDADEIAEAMAEARKPRSRPHIVEFARERVSMSAVAKRAAEIIATCVRAR